MVATISSHEYWNKLKDSGLSLLCRPISALTEHNLYVVSYMMCNLLIHLLSYSKSLIEDYTISLHAVRTPSIQCNSLDDPLLSLMSGLLMDSGTSHSKVGQCVLSQNTAVAIFLHFVDVHTSGVYKPQRGYWCCSHFLLWWALPSACLSRVGKIVFLV